MSTAPMVPIDYTRDEQTGWAIFAGIILTLNGFFAVMYGLAAVLNDEVVTVGGRGVAILDFTPWGWGTSILGPAMAVARIGLLLGTGGAPWFGLVPVLLHATASFAA